MISAFIVPGRDSSPPGDVGGCDGGAGGGGVIGGAGGETGDPACGWTGAVVDGAVARGGIGTA